MNELAAADGIPVAVTCRVLKFVRLPYYRWRANPVTDGEVTEAYGANGRSTPIARIRSSATAIWRRHARPGAPMAERTG